MSTSATTPSTTLLIQCCYVLFVVVAVVGADFTSEMNLTWGGDRAKITQNGGLLQLSLDRASGSGFQSKQQYLFGKIDMQIKLVPGFQWTGHPFRVFRNSEGLGVPYPKSQPMRLYSSLWCADDWATRGGLVKTDWTHAPFTASYRAFKADACVYTNGRSSCSSSKATWWNQALDSNAVKKLKWVQQNYMIYNYCSDGKRFPGGFPPECALKM
ncbi:hypothetical protein Sjap_014829 [Stephania japonica]|uniref:Xyloglucan endotransglucosylase/hydrolase n=1 Tax=Stephania japonica TaxID=461633 RepID=A0AAP0NQB1_9MAGN